MKQTFLVTFEKDGRTVDFYRHGEKKLQTVLAKEKKFFSNIFGLKSYQTLYGENFEDGVIFNVYQTNYEANDSNRVFSKPIKEFLTEEM